MISSFHPRQRIYAINLERLEHPNHYRRQNPAMSGRKISLLNNAVDQGPLARNESLYLQEMWDISNGSNRNSGKTNLAVQRMSDTK